MGTLESGEVYWGRLLKALLGENWELALKQVQALMQESVQELSVAVEAVPADLMAL